MWSENNRVMSSRYGGRGFKKKKAGSVLEKEPLQVPSCTESSDPARPDSQPGGSELEFPWPVGVQQLRESKSLGDTAVIRSGILKSHLAFSLSQFVLRIQPLFQSPEQSPCSCPVSGAERITVPSLPLFPRTGAVH